MKKLLTILIFTIGSSLFAGNEKLLDPISPSDRSELSTVWLETANSYFVKRKMSDAKALYLFAIELFPSGDSAKEARKLLEVNFYLTNRYDSNQVFQFFVKRADILTNEQVKLNNYLLGAIAKKDKDVLHNISIIYYNRNEIELMRKYLKEALDNGLSIEAVDTRMKDLLKE